MNPIEFLLNYLDTSKCLVILSISLILLITYLVLTSDSCIISDEPILHPQKISAHPSEENTKINKETNESKSALEEKDNIEIKGFHQNKIKAEEKKFILAHETEDVEQLSKKLINSEKNRMDKNDELSIMFIESLSSLNSWKNNPIEKNLFKQINWTLEKKHKELNEEESVVYQYIFPKSNSKESISSPIVPDLSSSQSSINSNSETEDDEEERKEREVLSKYKLGICRIFEASDENKIKSNIVKEVNGSLYKIYSEGNPMLIKEKCRKDTIPENFNEFIEKHKEKGYNVIGLAGKKMKMNYIQSQKVERSKCETNMIFLGFTVYKANSDGYKSAYS